MKALEITISFIKNCAEGCDEIVLAVPMDADNGSNACTMEEAIEQAARRAAKAVKIVEFEAKQLPLNNSAGSHDKAMVTDQIGSPPSSFASPVQSMAVLEAMACH